MGGSGRVMESERRCSMGLAGKQESLAQRGSTAAPAAIMKRCRERKRGPKEEEEVEGHVQRPPRIRLESAESPPSCVTRYKPAPCP